MTRAVSYLAVIVAVWVLTVALSGIGVIDMVFLAGPGIVLAIAAGWASNAFHTDEWNWRRARAAAMAGGTLFPPFVGLFVAWSATFEPVTMAVLMVAFAWLALLLGLGAALIGRGLARRASVRDASAHLLFIDAQKDTHAAD